MIPLLASVSRRPAELWYGQAVGVATGLNDAPTARPPQGPLLTNTHIPIKSQGHGLVPVGPEKSFTATDVRENGREEGQVA